MRKTNQQLQGCVTSAITDACTGDSGRSEQRRGPHSVCKRRVCDSFGLGAVPFVCSYCVRYGDTKLITIKPCLQEAHSLLVEDG